MFVSSGIVTSETNVALSVHPADPTVGEGPGRVAVGGTGVSVDGTGVSVATAGGKVIRAGWVRSAATVSAADVARTSAVGWLLG
jgi:hypothetical protein